jgi:phosphatidylglycerophosphate synthase
MGAIGVLLVSGALPGAAVIELAGEGLLWLAAMLTLITGYDYLTHGLMHMEAEDAKPKAMARQPANGLG